ncbi:hypothetical protein PIB30_097493 [Stylosanthes scabra]|uniref:Uncharacterized protein n=1 Tax=Stylosanthes scabra TaxID=79078 RepID=A0ABU6UXF8_9FABA|nr:hypothetical protein [Stylosanthes scabra]
MDQIQISLKCLLPSYQSILSDSAVVASFLSDQPSKKICANFEQNSVPENSDQRIANTDQELTTDPTQLHQIQENTDLDFHFQIQTELAPAYQKPESSRQFPEITTSEQSKSESEFQILNISSTHQEEEWNSVNSEDQKQEDEDELDARRLYRGSNDRSTVVAMQRPPLEPPDLYSFEVGDGAPPDLNSIAVGECEPESAAVTTKAGLCRTEDLSNAVTEIHSGARRRREGECG